jgi:hypothetical protein
VWCNGGVPWCADCDRYFTPPALQPDGSCPTCGRAVEGAPAPVRHAAAKDEALPPVPWHFKLMLAAFAVYLGYRFFEIGEWLVRRL